MYKINNVEVSEEQIRELIKDNPELKEEKKEFPQIGGKYWIISLCVETLCSTFTNDGIDNYRRDTGNFFETKYEAEKQLEKNEALARVNKYIRENDLRIKNVDWSDVDHPKYYIDYSEINNRLNYDYFFGINGLPLIGELKSIEVCKQLIENCKDDLLLILS